MDHANEPTTMVGADEFREAMRTLTEPLTAYAVAMAGDRDAMPRNPAPDSIAMAELAAEREWSTDDWSLPATNTHQYGRILIYALAEHLAAYAAVVEAGHVGPAYAHAPSARAIMEIAPTATWLLEPGIGVVARIKRGIAYRLASGNQVGRLQHIERAREQSERSRQAVTDYASVHGWEIADERGRVSVGSEVMPSPGESFSLHALGEPAVDLDRTLWSLLSALQHGTWYALSDGFAERLQPDPIGDQTGVVPIVISGPHLNLIGTLCWFACRSAYDAQRELFGWSKPDSMVEPEQRLVARASSIADQARAGNVDVTP